jgi:hypothetical protein
MQSAFRADTKSIIYRIGGIGSDIEAPEMHDCGWIADCLKKVRVVGWHIGAY